VFFASQIFTWLTQPLVGIIALLIASLWMRNRPTLARYFTGAALAVLLFLGWEPWPNLLVRHLEAQYAEILPQADLSQYVGMVVLGGSTDAARVGDAHQQLRLNGAAERLTVPVALLRTHPQLRMVYTGGGPHLDAGQLSEAARAKLFFDSMGVPVARVVYESASRTTLENATLTAQLQGIDITQRWLLVTSAWHMPRAMGTFSKAGWNVTAYPVDYRADSVTPWTAYSLGSGVRSWQLALHEWLGTLAYRLTGRM
jgi:uncharacterized SAM-binding protein YcdF (DUF218 family)